MTVVVLSLLTALAFGTADFCGGLAAKRTSTLRVVGLAHIIGFVGVVLAAVLIDNVFIWRDFGIGAVGGGFGGVGVWLLYRGLARGPMSVVAPVTAVSSAAVPALWGLITGDRPSPLVLAGLVVALVAIWMVSAGDDEDGLGVADESAPKHISDSSGRNEESDSNRSVVSAIVEALAAGTGFGLFFIFLDLTDPISSPWAVAGARTFTASVLSVALIVMALAARRSNPDGAARPTQPLQTWGFIALAGLLDTLANVMFLFALESGSLVVVAILTSLYPIATVVLASIVLNELMASSQRLGFLTALIATVMIAAG